MLRRISPIHQQGRVSPEQAELMRSLQEAQTALTHANLSFDALSDPELVESCIFEIRSLQARINYLLRALKALENDQPPLAASGGGGKRKWV